MASHCDPLSPADKCATDVGSGQKLVGRALVFSLRPNECHPKTHNLIASDVPKITVLTDFKLLNPSSFLRLNFKIGIFFSKTADFYSGLI